MPQNRSSGHCLNFNDVSRETKGLLPRSLQFIGGKVAGTDDELAEGSGVLLLFSPTTVSPVLTSKGLDVHGRMKICEFRIGEKLAVLMGQNVLCVEPG